MSSDECGGLLETTLDVIAPTRLVLIHPNNNEKPGCKHTVYTITMHDNKIKSTLSPQSST
eukprot:scaffold1290_cov112-Skeletonema_dohrnii-CCMP3373.AAC.13